MKICKDCLFKFKRSKEGKLAKAFHGKWCKEIWPKGLYHDEKTKKCLKHHIQSLSDSSARRAGLAKATPVWADRKKIKDVYTRCALETKETGIRHEVDHIIPLKGKLVSGLHVHWNLQVITAVDNRNKSNKV